MVVGTWLRDLSFSDQLLDEGEAMVHKGELSAMGDNGTTEDAVAGSLDGVEG